MNEFSNLLLDDFDLDLQITTDLVPAAASGCDTSDGCAPSCASACASNV